MDLHFLYAKETVYKDSLIKYSILKKVFRNSKKKVWINACYLLDINKVFSQYFPKRPINTLIYVVGHKYLLKIDIERKMVLVNEVNSCHIV